MALTTVVAPTAAYADAPEHYYIEVGGTGNALPPEQGCTKDYQAANGQLDDPAQAVPVCYPATAGPFIGGITAPYFDDSVSQGYRNAIEAVEKTHRDHPDARLTITGYSQGAQIADQVLQTIANGGTDVPSSQVNGKLYADPMQPGTGIWSVVPKGWSALGFTSPGAGPDRFGDIPVQRYCIHTDGICDAPAVPQSIVGYFTQHPRYPGEFIPQTMTQDGGDPIVWFDARG